MGIQRNDNKIRNNSLLVNNILHGNMDGDSKFVILPSSLHFDHVSVSNVFPH